MKLVLKKNLLELLFPHITYKRMRKNGIGFTHTHTHKLKSRIGKDMPSKNSKEKRPPT